MITAIYWFRHDLRLVDNLALVRACEEADELTLVYVRDANENSTTRWGFPVSSPLRRAFRDTAVDGLAVAIRERGGTLLELNGAPATVLTDLSRVTGATRIYCEDIPAPDERSDLAALRAAGLDVRTTWQSTLIEREDLPFDIAAMPDVFTAFRQRVERAGITPHRPLAAPLAFPRTSSAAPLPDRPFAPARQTVGPAAGSFPFGDPAFHGTEEAALGHVDRYFRSGLPATYKASRNGLSGIDYSTKFSPWLAVGSLSPRTVVAALKKHEEEFGASDGSYWIWFELLWRDFFRFWSERHGVRLFRAEGLSTRPPPAHDTVAFRRWCDGTTGQPFVDAGMRELKSTGYLSNRLRQVVASYVVHDLACDWRAGAAWFESQLIDYDVCSNHGNWLYIAGRGADPRQGRRFDPEHQAAVYDPDGAYRALWAIPTDSASS
jgi:deoxyribodipyrimidine photo-lyase